MSYGRPGSTLAWASWAGAPAYTRPGAAAADAEWETPTPTEAKAADAGPLRQPVAVARAAPVAVAALPTLLGVPQVVASSMSAMAAAATPLGAPVAIGYVHYGDQVDQHAPVTYVADLTTPAGTVRVPVSSWQATLQTGRMSYVGAVVPGCEPYVDDLTAATAFSISRRGQFIGGAPLEQIMAAAPISYVQLARGTSNYSASINGYGDAFEAVAEPDPAHDRTLAGIRTIVSGSGGYRVRCAIDWQLRPGQRAWIDGGTSFVVDYINYQVSGGDAYMDVGQRED